MEVTSPHSQPVPQDHLAPFPREEDRPIFSRSRKLVTGPGFARLSLAHKASAARRERKNVLDRHERSRARAESHGEEVRERKPDGLARALRSSSEAAKASPARARSTARGVTAFLCIANDERESEKRRDGLRPSWGGRRCPRSRTGRRGGAWRPAGDEGGAGGSVSERERWAARGERERDGRTSTHERAGLWSPNTRE